MNPNPAAAREALAAKREAEKLQPEQDQDTPFVPVVTADEVAAIKAQLAAEREAREAAERALNTSQSQLQQYQGVAFGLPQAQPAEPYVADEDLNIPGMNELNAGDVIAGADYAGKPGWKTSRVTHRLGNKHTAGRAGTFWYYDDGGYARKIPAQSASSAIASGLWPVCPICKGYHPESETNPNACPKKPKVAKISCKICAANGSVRNFYDVVPKTMPVVNDDDFDLDDDMAELPSTPKERLRVIYEQHIRAYHEQTANTMKLQGN